MTPIQRLKRIAAIIEGVDQRAMAVDGPVSKTCDEITDTELRDIYKLATYEQKQNKRKRPAGAVRLRKQRRR